MQGGIQWLRLYKDPERAETLQCDDEDASISTLCSTTMTTMFSAANRTTVIDSETKHNIFSMYRHSVRRFLFVFILTQRLENFAEFTDLRINNSFLFRIRIYSQLSTLVNFGVGHKFPTDYCAVVSRFFSYCHYFSLSKSTNSTKIPKLKVNNVDVTSPKQISNSFNNYFCSVGENLAANIHNNKTDFLKYCTTEVKESMFCTPVTPHEIQLLALTFRVNKAPGPDNIGAKLLKCVLDKLLDPLVFIFNLSFNTGKVPESLKIAKVIPIYKKGERTNPTNYRPISLLSIFDKILEKLMHKRLHLFLQQHS